MRGIKRLEAIGSDDSSAIPQLNYCCRRFADALIIRPAELNPLKFSKMPSQFDASPTSCVTCVESGAPLQSR